jgi:protein ImuB
MPWLRAERAAAERGIPPEAPLAVVEARGGALRVLDRSAAAEKKGIAPGMTLSEARARLRELWAVPADPAADEAALERAGDRAFDFGPCVHLLAPDAVAVEISGSAHLFGGERALAMRAARDAASAGFRAKAAVAGTVGAAWGIARFGSAEIAIVAPGGEAEALGPLPLAALRLDPRSSRWLAALGIRSVATLLDLDRDGLRARFGEAVSRRIAEVLGEIEELLPVHSPARRFRSRLRFPEPVEGGEMLVRGAARLAGRAAAWLFSRLEGARRLALDIEVEGGPTQRIEVGLAAPLREGKRILSLLRMRLDGARFLGRVAALALEVEESAPLALAQMPLLRFGGAFCSRSPALDSLAARLGEKAVLRAQLVDDWRPEHAFRLLPLTRVAASRERPPPPAAKRALPPCLLERPRPVAVGLDEEGMPARLGSERIRTVRGPERIASGWWSGREAERDYFEVEMPDGLRLWVCREAGRWFVHGVF